MAENQLDKIQECFSKPHKYKYEDRLVAYIDILGWKKATTNNSITKKVKEALSLLDDSYTHFSSQFKENLHKTLGKERVNPISQNTEVGFFSDGILISIPANYKGRIFNISAACRELLAIGFLCRGAITRGYCYHRENRVFGPAINDIIRLEKEAIFPRILCTNKIVEIAKNSAKNTTYITTDILGRNVLNLFNPVCDIIDAEVDEVKSEHEKMLLVQKIKNKIKKSIKEYNQDECNERISEKWRYAELLMTHQLKVSVYDKL